MEMLERDGAARERRRGVGGRRRPRRALTRCGDAQDAWQRVGAPYLSARIRLLVARAFQALGDDDGAALELDAARKTFVQLGAAPDVAAIEAMRPTAPAAADAGPVPARTA